MESINAATTEKVTLRNKIFDLVLNLNTLNDVKGDLAMLQDKVRLEQEKSSSASADAKVFKMTDKMPKMMMMSLISRAEALDDI